MVAEISGKTVPTALAAAQTTTAKPARPKTQAELTLDQVLTDLKGSDGRLAEAAAQNKLSQAKVKLEGLKLAAGSVAASGDGRWARQVAKDIRDTARDITRTLSGLRGAAEKPATDTTTATVPDVRETAAQSAARQIRALEGLNGPGGAGQVSIDSADLADLKSAAADVARDLKAVMKKLRVTSQNPFVEDRDRGEMEKMFGSADREVASLRSASAPTAGMKINIRA